MNPKVIADLTLFVGVPLCVLTTFLLLRAYQADRSSRVMRRDLAEAFAVTVTVFVFALIFRNNDTLPFPPLDTDATKIVTRLFMMGLAFVASLTFLWLWWKDS